MKLPQCQTIKEFVEIQQQLAMDQLLRKRESKSEFKESGKLINIALGDDCMYLQEGCLQALQLNFLKDKEYQDRGPFSINADSRTSTTSLAPSLS